MTPGMRLRSHLIALVLAVLVPMVVFAAIVVVMFGRQQRAAAERGALETARALMNAVDEALGSTVTTLEALATARSLAQGDLKEFHAEARRVLATQPDWKDIILLAPDGRQLVNTARPWGAPLPSASEPASLEAVVLTRRPVVGDIARGRLSGEYAVPVRVPVMRSERVAYVLTGVLKPAALGGVLARQRIPADWIGIVFDRRNMIVVRTRRVEEFLGRSLSPDLVAVLGRGAPEGWAVTRTLEGTPVYTAYARSPKTGWGIAFGIPRASVDAPLERSLLAIGAGGVAFAVLALALAALVGRRITAPMATLADAARHFGEGGTMHADGPAGVSEVDDVRRAFVGAAALVQQRAAEAEAAARAKDQFLAVVSHELRTPLNAVYGWARMLQSGQVGEEQMKRALDVIVRQSDAQVQLIDDLLDVSRVISGKMRLDVRPLELTAVVEQALDAVRPAADAKEVRLQSVLDPRVVAGDPDRLRQVTWNLLMNAVKFTPNGGRVQARLQRAASHVEIVVSDTGRGIAPDVRLRALPPGRFLQHAGARGPGPRVGAGQAPGRAARRQHHRAERRRGPGRDVRGQTAARLRGADASPRRARAPDGGPRLCGRRPPG